MLEGTRRRTSTWGNRTISTSSDSVMTENQWAVEVHHYHKHVFLLIFHPFFIIKLIDRRRFKWLEHVLQQIWSILSIVSWVFCISFDKDVPVKCNLFPPLPSWLCPQTPRHSLTVARSYMHKQNVIAIKGNVTANQRQPSLSRWRALSILHLHRSAWSASTFSRNNNRGLIFSEAWHKFPLSPTAWRQIEILR